MRRAQRRGRGGGRRETSCRCRVVRGGVVANRFVSLVAICSESYRKMLQNANCTVRVIRGACVLRHVMSSLIRILYKKARRVSLSLSVCLSVCLCRSRRMTRSTGTIKLTIRFPSPRARARALVFLSDSRMFVLFADIR